MDCKNIKEDTEINISVIVPVYNMDRYFDRAMKSLLNQRFMPYEIILVDDGSTDNSADMCDNYASNYEFIKVIHKENGGLSSARNTGMKTAKGNYIIFTDPDDWVDDDYLETLVNLKLAYPEYLPTIGFYVDNEHESKKCRQYKDIVKFDKNEALKALMLSTYFCGFTVNKLYDLDLIRSYNLEFDLELGKSQDLIFAYQYICLCNKVVYSSSPKYHYFQHVGGVTNSPITSRKMSGFLTYQRLHDLALKDNNLCVAEMAKATICNLSLNMLYTYFNTKSSDLIAYEEIKRYLNYNCFVLLKSEYHSLITKTQAVIAIVSPFLYFKIKKLLKG